MSGCVTCLTELGKYHVLAYVVDSWKLSQRRVKNIQCFHSYKIFNWHLEQRRLVPQWCHLAVMPPKSRPPPVMHMWSERDMTRIFWNVDIMRIKQIQHIQGLTKSVQLEKCFLAPWQRDRLLCCVEFHIETWGRTVQNGRCWSSVEWERGSVNVWYVAEKSCESLTEFQHFTFPETFLRTTELDITSNYESSSVDCEERLWPPVAGRKSDRLTHRPPALLLAEQLERKKKKTNKRGE